MDIGLAGEAIKTASAVIASAVQPRRDVQTRFQPGNPGNPGGRPRTAHLRKAALRQLRLAVAGDLTQLDCVVDSTIQTAIGGGGAGVAAFTALRDTVDGKPTANDNAPHIGTINIAWGSMPGWASRGDAATVPPVGSSNQCDNTTDCSLNSNSESGVNTPPEVQLKVLESAPRRPAQERPTKLRDRVQSVPAPSVPVQAASRPMSVTRMVAERALAKLADMDTVGMSPATFKNYLAKVRVAEEALAAL